MVRPGLINIPKTMKTVNTGKGRITLLTLIAIWSISLVVDLPGLAITPVMAGLDTIFPHASHLEIQLLSVLPNFCIIPFILLSGRLSMSRSQTGLIDLGMIIFLIGGVACLFAESMTALIITSCLIGVGCGIVIPLAAGVIAEHFAGVERVRQMGIKSGIANFTLIFATLIVGWIGTKDWHLPFLVYLVPVIPLALSPFLTKKYIARTSQGAEMKPVKPSPHGPVAADSVTSTTDSNSSAGNPVTPLQRARATRRSRNATTWGIIIFYLAITICSITITYYIPFVMQDNRMTTSQTSIVTSIFFLFVTAAGFTLPYIVKALRNATTTTCLIIMMLGLLIVSLGHTLWLYIIAVILIGYGYGLLQPIFYTKASLLAPTSAMATNTISYIMTANYLGTAVTPLLFSGLQQLFHIPGHSFAFWLGLGFMAIVLVFAIVKKKSYVFYTSLQDA